MYSVSSDKETQISNESIGQWHPTIYGNRIVWEYWYDNYIHADIYMATISGEEPEAKTLIANFTANPPSGYVPLTVQFIDISQNATGWNWDFGDGTNSTFQNPEHTYSSPGDYVVNMTLSNEKVNASKTTTIHVDDYLTGPYIPYDSGSGTSGGGGSPEPTTNVEVKELSQAIVTSGNSANFDFPKNATSIVNVSFDSKKNIGRTITTVEMLKNKSALTSETPIGEVYKYLNIWIGYGGYATEKNIENAVVGFRVAKSWVQDKKIDKSTITLNRYNDKIWNQLPNILLNEDDNFLYFKAKTPGFSPFAITGKITATGTTVQPAAGNKTPSAMDNSQNNTGNKTVNTDQIHERTKSINTSRKEGTKTPDFEISSGIICLLSVILYMKR
jgi:PGF-pre-PGF domain-containing protein